MLRDVAALLDAEIHPFELGVVCEVFGLDRSDDGLPVFDFAVCASDPGPVDTAGGLRLAATHGLDRARTADLIVIPAWHTRPDPPEPAIVDLLHAAVDRGATVLSVCSGAFLLAATGLLDGRSATCHWRHSAQFRARWPYIQLDPDRLYVEDGPVVSSAGTAAGIDACLYLVRRELGATVANGIARRMVVPPHREGGQAQYVELPVPACADDGLGPVLAWAQRNLDRALTVAELAARAHMSGRTFARRFRAATGSTPQRWITRQRLFAAQRLLEQGDLDIDRIAQQCGFGTGAMLRHHFKAELGTTPHSYRRTFAASAEPVR